jgi:hypothetical protein
MVWNICGITWVVKCCIRITPLILGPISGEWSKTYERNPKNNKISHKINKNSNWPVKPSHERSTNTSEGNWIEEIMMNTRLVVWSFFYIYAIVLVGRRRCFCMFTQINNNILKAMTRTSGKTPWINVSNSNRVFCSK